MPRTKQVRKKSSISKKQKSIAHSEPDSDIQLFSTSTATENEMLMSLLSREYESNEEFMREYDKFYKAKIEEYQKGYEHVCEKIKEYTRNILQALKSKSKIIRPNDAVTEVSNDQNKDPNVQVPRVRPSRSRTPADRFEFKRPKTPPVTSSTRSVSRKRSASASAASSTHSSASGFKTPFMSTRRLPPNATITPKISDTPISMMRRPLHGEMALSMSGSPLMVGPVASEEIPTVNVPLQDGRVFSIMPEPGAHPPDLPQIDDVTKQYLKTLRAHLQIMAPDTP